jgi:hypothetical protein
MDTFDKFLSSKIQNDYIDLNVDNSAFNQLHYMVNLNSTKSNVKKNSMFSFLSDFISPRFVAAKLAFVAVLLVLVIGNKENHIHQNLNFLCDSTFVQSNSYDTINALNNHLSDSLIN